MFVFSPQIIDNFQTKQFTRLLGLFILTQQCVVENEYAKSGHLSLHLVEALDDAFGVQYFRTSFFAPFKDTDSM